MVSKLDKSIRDYLLKNEVDEEQIIVKNMNFLLKRLAVSEIVIYNAEDPTVPDVKGKKSQALPLSPAIVIE